MLQRPVATLLVFIVADDLLRVGHPLQVVGILVGHDDLWLLAESGAQHFGPAQAAAQRVAVGILVAHADDGLALADELQQLLLLLSGNDVVQHN